MASEQSSSPALPSGQRRRGSMILGVFASIIFIAFGWLRPAVADPKKAPDAASDVDSEHLFGFTEGSDIGKRGEREAEIDSTGRFGRLGGTYTAISTAFEAKYSLSDYFRISGSATLGGYNLSAVPGFDDRRQLVFQEVAVDLRYRMLDWEKAPFGLTLVAEPHRGFADGASGAPADRYGTHFALLVDKEIIAKRVYAAFNLLYEPETTRLFGTATTERESVLGASAAVAAQVQPGMFWGIEARYLRHYDGVAFCELNGAALYVGPTLYAKLWGNWLLSAAWNVQIAGGRTGLSNSLDLTDFERQQAKLRLGVSF
jgi:hypothetical protein